MTPSSIFVTDDDQAYVELITDQTWQETKLRIDSLRFEYTTIFEELMLTDDQQRAIGLRARASACIAESLTMIRQYRASNPVRNDSVTVTLQRH